MLMMNPRSEDKVDCLTNELEKYRQMKSRINAILSDANLTPANSNNIQKTPAEIHPACNSNNLNDDFKRQPQPTKVSTPKAVLNKFLGGDQNDFSKMSYKTDFNSSNNMSMKTVSNFMADRESFNNTNANLHHSNILKDHNENVNNSNQDLAKIKPETKFNDYQVQKSGQFVPKTPENNLKRSELESSVPKNSSDISKSKIIRFGLLENKTPVKNLNCDSSERKMSESQTRKNSIKAGYENSASGKLSERMEFKERQRERSQERIEDSLFSNCGKNPQSKQSWKLNSLSSSAQKKNFIDQSPVHNVHELQVEVEKWKRFAKIMTDSYEQLNIQSNRFFQEIEQTKIHNNQLKAEVSQLKELLQKKDQENAHLQSRLAEIGSKEYQDSQEEIQKLYEQIDFLKAENFSLRNTVKDQERVNPQELHYFKNLAEQKVKECSILAEETICLRTDLDRSHSAYLHLQRETALTGKQQTMEKTHSFAQLTSSRTYFENASREKTNFGNSTEKGFQSPQVNTLKKR